MDDELNDPDEIRDGFIVRRGTRLRPLRERERIAATHLISGFNLHETFDGWPMGTVVWFEGNNKGVKVPGGGELGPRSFSTAPRGFWTRLESDLKLSMRIDRQKPFAERGHRFHDYHLQVGSESIACVLLRVNVFVGAAAIRRAFNLSLEATKIIMIDPTDHLKGYMHVP